MRYCVPKSFQHSAVCGCRNSERLSENPAEYPDALLDNAEEVPHYENLTLPVSPATCVGSVAVKSGACEKCSVATCDMQKTQR